MAFPILDGTGRGYHSAVNSNNQLEVRAVSQSDLRFDSEVEKNAFYAISGFVALTTTVSFSGIFYLQNAGPSVHVHQLRTCGSVSAQWRLIKNPTTGTLISAGTSIPPQNINFTSPTQYDGSVLYGVDGSTIADGDALAQWINGVGHSNTLFDGAIILGNGDTMALEVQPAAAGDVCVSVLLSQE